MDLLFRPSNWAVQIHEGSAPYSRTSWPSTPDRDHMPLYHHVYGDGIDGNLYFLPTLNWDKYHDLPRPPGARKPFKWQVDRRFLIHVKAIGYYQSLEREHNMIVFETGPDRIAGGSVTPFYVEKVGAFDPSIELEVEDVTVIARDL